MPGQTSAQQWLTPQRIRRQALILAIALWLGYAITIATPGLRDRFGHLKGEDFLHAYILGSIALDHRGDALYDAAAQRAIGEQLVPQSTGDYFLPVYGPQYSLIWIPFASLPYAWAVTLWMLVSAAIYAACTYAIWRTCPNLRAYGGTVAIAAAAFPGFFSLITFAQNSSLALACFTAAYFALRARREFLAGIFLGLLGWKPQLGLGAAFVFAAACFRREKSNGKSKGKSKGSPTGSAFQIILGALLAILAQFATAWAWYGSRPLLTYVHVLTRLNSAAPILEPRPYLMHSLRAFWNLLLPWPTAAFILYVITALVTLALAIAFWNRTANLEHRYTVLLLATVLVAPHLTVYDLVILVPAFLWIAEYWISERGIASAPAFRANSHIAWLLYLSYILPFAGPLARWTHLQLSVIFLASLTVILTTTPERASERDMASL